MDGDRDTLLGDSSATWDVAGETSGAGPVSLEMELARASLKAQLFHKVSQPTRIGRFLLLERIGAGAMGEVYAAYDEQLDRKVAIKLVCPERLEHTRDGTGAQASQRLLREAQILARLSHPNVVQVYEAGMVGDRVFLAMEFIRGQNLSQWLASQGAVPGPARWRTVLDIFLAAGRGLEAAHAAGLVHRDFKPGNVLVGDNGRVCVADFGVARAVQDRAGAGQARAALDHAASLERTLPGDDSALGQPGAALHKLTRSGMIVGTPAYMSPEQLQGQPSDSRSDQFSFCVALYEALYGARPFVAEDLLSLRELVVSGLHAAPPRRTEVPAWIWKVLQRGLASKPAERHASMTELLAALARDPVERRRRLVHTTAMGALALCASALAGVAIAQRDAAVTSHEPCALAGTSVATLWSRPAVVQQAQQAFLATGVPYAGTIWAQVDKRLGAYATALADERRATCEATHIRHEQPEAHFALESLCLDRRERALEALVAELVRADARTVEHSARAVDGLPRIEACRDGEALVLGVQPPTEPALAARVGEIRQALATAEMQHLAGHRSEALELATAQLEATRALPYPPVHAEALRLIGVLWSDGRTDAEIAQAEQALLDAVDLAESHRHDELVSQLWLDLLLLSRRYHQDFTRAHQWARRALATSNRFDDGGRQRSLALARLGSLHARQGELARAERFQRDALALAERSGVSRLALADQWHDLAITLQGLERTREAHAAYEQALDIFRAELGNGHPRLARLSFDFAMFLRHTGDLDRGRALLGQVLATWTATHGETSRNVADVHLELANLESEAGNLEQAESHARRAHELYGQVFDPESGEHYWPELMLGVVAFKRQRWDEALAAFERALAIERRAAPDDHQAIALLQSNIGETLVEQGRHEHALRWFDDAERTLARAGAVQPGLSEAMLLKGRGLALLGKGGTRHARRAIPLLERALVLMEAQPGYPSEQAAVKWALARALHKAGHWPDERARALARSAQQLYQARGRAGAAASQAISTWLADDARQ